MNAPEIWRPVAGYEDRYEVSNLGRVRSLRFINNQVDKARDEPKILKPRAAGLGYLAVDLHKDDVADRQYVHRLVLSAFVGLPPQAGMDAAHIDGRRQHNVPENLMWATRSENLSHRDRHGTAQKGLKANGAKLSAEQVRELRAAPRLRDAVALGYVAKSGVESVRARKTYKDVT